MTKAQKDLYWREWRKVADRLKRAGYSAAELDDERRALMRQACGKDVSSKALTNRQFDEVLKAFRAASGDDLNAVMTDGSRSRLLHGIRNLATDAYIMSIVADVWPGTKTWTDLPVEDLQKLRMRLARAKERRATHNAQSQPHD